MLWLQYAATRRQRAATAYLFLTGAALIAAAAAGMSYANIEPQRAKTAERRKVIKAFIARKRAAVGGAGGGDYLPQSHPDAPKP